MSATDLARTHAAAFPADPWSEQTIADLMASSNTVLVGDATAFVMGRVTLDEAEILTLATALESRRQGLARTRLSAFLTLAADRGARSAFLEVAADNKGARALYAAAGFAQVGLRKGYYARPDSTPVDALILRRDLPLG